MTDPLSISASIAGLVTLADVVFSRTYRYVRAVKKASNEISALSSELGALYGVLCSVRSVSIQLEDEAFEPTTRVQNIYSCQKTLEDVKGMLDRDKSSFSDDEPWETMKRKLRWPFKTSEVKSLMSDIERHKTTLGLALQADGVAGLLQVLSGQKDLTAGMEDIKSELRLKREIDIRVVLNEERHNILETFGKIDPRRSHDMSRKLRHPGTGVWLTESPTFQHWLHSINECLWLYGIPGAGKTVLASLAIDEVLQKSTQNHAIAYFYCDYKDQTTQEPRGIMGSLAQQIAKQDEQSFEKLRRFYGVHGQGRRDPVAYAPTLLRDLVKDLTSNYESTSIIIDALDECMGNVRDVVELLTSLNDDTGDVNVNLLLFSRDEVEIRDYLNTKPQISVAAENSDLRLYVGAEIEERIRKKMLKIKSPSLKEHIVERLIGGAEGMFRWVTCQMDYLCELPNDAARRKALGNLPRGLTLTYERILRRINGSNAEVQKLARRTFRWLFFKSRNSRLLCEAVSIDPEDVCIDHEAVPDESDILRHCGSLIRKSADGEVLEFAHFTVKEFLSQLDGTKNSEFAAYAMDAGVIGNELAKVCLTYITTQDFDHWEEMSKETFIIEITKRPFRLYAYQYWHLLVRDWHDIELVKLLKRLFHPSKNGTLVSWAQWLLFPEYFMNFDKAIAKGNAGVKEATALHYAAMLCIPEICQWLIEDGCDVNRWSAFGTPLQCAVLGLEGCYHSLDRYFVRSEEYPDSDRRLATVDLLLAAGSSPNTPCGRGNRHLSILKLALQACDPVQVAIRLLLKGAHFDEKDLKAIYLRCDDEDELQETEECLLQLTQRLCQDATIDVSQEIILKRALIMVTEGETGNSETLLPKGLIVKELTTMQKTELEISMRTAAEFGQLELMTKLLDQYKIFVDVACQSTGKTALQLAAANDHLEITKTLINRGANIAATDFVGKMAIHHSIRGSGYACLRFLLEQDINVNLPDMGGMTVWHEAVSKKNAEALRLLVGSHRYQKFSSQEAKTMKKPQSPLSYAAQKASVGFLSLLISGGCSVHDVDAKGLTPIHHAVNACSLEKIQFLVEYGSDVSSVMQDGSSPLHLAVNLMVEKRQEVVEFLISKGSDPFLARHDGITPIDLLIRSCPAERDFQATQKVLQILLQWRNPHSSVQLDLSQHFLRLCELDLTDRSLWLSIALETLLQNGVDLTRENDAGETAFSVLLYSWLRIFSILPNLNIIFSRRNDHKAKAVIRTALNHTPAETLSNPHYDLPCLFLSAIIFGDELLAKKVLEFSPDVDYIPTFGGQNLSVIEAASRWNCSDALFKVMLDRSKASSDQVLATKLFTQVAEDGRIGLADILLDAGLNLNSCSTRGGTPLMLASGRGHVDMVSWLIEHGSDVKSVDQNGWNAGHYACVSRSLEVIHVLQTTDIDWHARVKANFYHYASDEVALLHIAAGNAESFLTKYLIDEGIAKDLNCTTSLGDTPLHIAVSRNDIETVAFLLSKNVMTNIIFMGESPLHLCVRLGDKNMYSLLRSQGCDPRTPNEEGLDCEMIAWKYGHKELTKEIALDNARGENRVLVSLISPLKALKLAIELDDLHLCEKAVAEGASPESHLPGCNGTTALLYCVQMNKPTIAKFLVLKGVSNIVTAEGFNLFHLAAWTMDSGLLEALLEKHSSELPQNMVPLHPMHMAIVYSAKECVNLILNHTYRGNAPILASPSDLHKPTQYAGSPPICNAPARRTEPAVNFLANVSISESLGPNWKHYRIGEYFLDEIASYKPLHLAAAVGDCDIAKRLLAAGSRVNAVNSFCETALHIAARQGNSAITEILLGSGASIFDRNIRLETPSMVAAGEGHLCVLQALLKKGVDLEARDFKGDTILHIAAESGSTESLAYILNTMQDFDLETKSLHGISVLEWAFLASRNGLSFLLNIAPCPHFYTPEKVNFLTAAISNPNMTVQHVKMLLKWVPSELLTSILNNQAKYHVTPLYAACVRNDARRECEIINLLLDAGASIDKDGGIYGTPLIAACTAGRLSAVKLLISRGAQTTFRRGDQTRNVLHAAKNFPEIVHWLLIGRFTEGPRLLTLDSHVR